ncbi:MAG: LptF/LptG family permease [Leptospirales bacterium]
MKFFKPTILSRYTLSNFIPPFIVGLIFFTFIVLLFSMREAIKAAIEKNIDVFYILELLTYSMGWTLGMTIPMSALLAIIMAVGTMNGDSEIIAMRAGGMKYTTIFRPFVYFGGGMIAVLLLFHLEVVPYCAREMKVIAYNIYKYNPTAIIEEGQFSLLEEGKKSQRHIYVGSIEPDPDHPGMDILKNVQIKKSDKITKVYRLSEFIVAEKGYKILKELEGGVWIKAIRLHNGYIFTEDNKSGVYQTVDFTNGYLDINIQNDINNFALEKKREFNGLSLSELLDRIDNYNSEEEKHGEKDLIRLKSELHKRIALSFATFLFLYLGFPMGIINKRSGKGLGLGQSVIFIFIYFGLFLSSDAMAVNFPQIPPFLTAWFGNITILIFAVAINLLKTSEINWQKVFRSKKKEQP